MEINEIEFWFLREWCGKDWGKDIEMYMLDLLRRVEV